MCSLTDNFSACASFSVRFEISPNHQLFFTLLSQNYGILMFGVFLHLVTFFSGGGIAFIQIFYIS